MEERLLKIQPIPAVTNSSAQNTANHITASVIAGGYAISDRKTYGSYMVSDDAHGHIHLFLFTVR